MLVFLVPSGPDRFELYSEFEEEPEAPPADGDGRLRRWFHTVTVQWHALVESARQGGARGRLGRWRDSVVCRLAESIAEQRTLWALRNRTGAVLRFQSTLDTARARAIHAALLAHARAHHLKWLVIDLLLFVGSGVFFFIPGPNLIAYYFAFRFVGHLQSWRGARQAIDVIRWTFEPEPGLSELASLLNEPRTTRAPQVAAVAARLHLRRLAAFFDRVARPAT